MKKTEQIILEWAKIKGILPGSLKPQSDKLLEEVLEFLTEVNTSNIEAAKMELADVLVVCTILANMLGTDIETSLELAYTKIKDRKGKMVDGQFVKEK